MSEMTTELQVATHALAGLEARAGAPGSPALASARTAAQLAVATYLAAAAQDAGLEIAPEAAAAVHLTHVCQEAGLGSMAGIFEFVIDRELEGVDLLAVTAEDVSALYDTVVGPAVDQVEMYLPQQGEPSQA